MVQTPKEANECILTPTRFKTRALWNPFDESLCTEFSLLQWAFAVSGTSKYQ